MTTHLSEEMLNDALIGLASREAELHLARCAECRAQVEQFQSDMVLFNQASLAWSVARPGRTVGVGISRTGFKVRFAAGMCAAAAAVVLAVGVPVWHHVHTPVAKQDTAATITPQDTEAQIAEDNKLLEAVNAAIDPKDESPIDQFQISDNLEKTHKPRPR